MANNPIWFDQDYYISSKLQQLAAEHPEQHWTADSLEQAMGAVGMSPLAHFEAFSLAEHTSPNTFFDAASYMAAKLQQLQHTDPNGGWSAAKLAGSLQDAGLNPWEHYQQFGWQEHLNPSAGFGTDAYLNLKLAALQEQDPGGDWSAPKLSQALRDGGLDPVSHYLGYGRAEGIDMNDPAPAPDSAIYQAALAKGNTNNGISSIPGANSTEVRSIIENTSTKWFGSTVTYSFPTTKPASYNSESPYEELSANRGWEPVNNYEINAAKGAFKLINELVVTNFVQTTGSAGDIRINASLQPVDNYGFAYYPPGSGSRDDIDGDVFLNVLNRNTNDFYAPGTDNYLTVLHEIGHAVGLKHTFERPAIAASKDNYDYSVMSYDYANNWIVKFTGSGATTTGKALPHALPDNYGIYDMAALQTLYGVNTSTRTGDDTYTLNAQNHEFVRIWDAGGTDTIDVSNATRDSTIDLNPGTFSSIEVFTAAQQISQAASLYPGYGAGQLAALYNNAEHPVYTGHNNLSIAFGTVIENLKTGSGNDTVYDNAYNNRIFTGAGDDTIHLGRGGFDYVDGGEGNDRVILQGVRSTQVQQEYQDDGSLILVGSHFAAQLVGIEQLVFDDGTLSVGA